MTEEQKNGLYKKSHKWYPKFEIDQREQLTSLRDAGST